MNPNPCKYCGDKPKKGCGYYCGRHGSVEEMVDFDTWQKNNPLPHQFKVGDWVKVIGEDALLFGKKIRIDDIGDPENLVGDFHAGGVWWWKNEIEPATSLKRKKIRERLDKELRPYVMTSRWDLLDALIEEI